MNSLESNPLALTEHVWNAHLGTHTVGALVVNGLVLGGVIFGGIFLLRKAFNGALGRNSLSSHSQNSSASRINKRSHHFAQEHARVLAA